MMLEKMNVFFDKRADLYDNHMIVDMQLAEFYEEIANYFPIDTGNLKLLDLGCGTGLELDRLFEKMPRLSVTGVDLSREMMNVLAAKYANKEIKLICDSYFDVNLDVDVFDYALSTYSLHHFSETQKLFLYSKIHTSLRNGGIYVEGDYTCKTKEQQQSFLAENERLRKENGITDGCYHYDTPFTAACQIKLLKTAGFSEVTLMKEWDNTSIIVARK